MNNSAFLKKSDIPSGRPSLTPRPSTIMIPRESAGPSRNSTVQSKKLKLEELEITLYERLKNAHIDSNNPFYMINTKPKPDEKCFLSDEDIKSKPDLANLEYPIKFCRLLRKVCEPIVDDSDFIKNMIKNTINHLHLQLDDFQVKIIRKLIPSTKPYRFFQKLDQGKYDDLQKLLKSLEKIIRKWKDYQSILTKNRVEKCLNKLEEDFKQSLKELEEKIVVNFKDSAPEIPIAPYEIPKSLELSQVVQIQSHTFPYTNGLDVHPKRDMYIAFGCNNGSVFIRNLLTNEEIKQIKIDLNSNGYSQNCMFNPSGNKFLVTTIENQAFYIFDDAGSILSSSTKTNKKNIWGAIWLSDNEIALGYKDGLLKFYNINHEQELGSMKLEGNNIWGMDCIDRNNLVVGNNLGNIYAINSYEKCIIWKKEKWHRPFTNCSVLKLSSDKTLLATGSSDFVARMMKIDDQSLLWEYKLLSFIRGIEWAPGDSYLFVLGDKSQLIALNSKNGEKILDFTNICQKTMTLKLIKRKKELMVGSSEGKIYCIKIN